MKSNPVPLSSESSLNQSENVVSAAHPKLALSDLSFFNPLLYGDVQKIIGASQGDRHNKYYDSALGPLWGCKTQKEFAVGSGPDGQCSP